MDKQVAQRLAEQRLAEWSGSVSYGDLAWANDNESSTTQQVSEGGTDYTVESTVWREQGAQAFTMGVRVTEADGRSFFRKAVSRYGRMYPDGRFADGA
jgi:hypothetical protein